MEKISAIVTCFNREEEIGSCLESLKWADELIVVDSFSTDGTVEIARGPAAKFFQRRYVSPGEQKNWAIRQASYSWILAIDSDEMIPPALRDEILSEMKNPRYHQYKAYRRNFFRGKEIKHCGWDTDKIIIIFKKDRYRYREDVVHDRLIPEDRFGFFKNKVIHHPHRSIEDFINRSNRYARGGAKKYFREGRRGTAFKMLLHAVFNFLKMYVFRLGFLDGARGLVICTLSSCYVAEKYARLWEMTEEKENLDHGETD